jgi:hypothetical protein
MNFCGTSSVLPLLTLTEQLAAVEVRNDRAFSIDMPG